MGDLNQTDISLSYLVFNPHVGPICPRHSLCTNQTLAINYLFKDNFVNLKLNLRAKIHLSTVEMCSWRQKCFILIKITETYENQWRNTLSESQIIIYREISVFIGNY